MRRGAAWIGGALGLAALWRLLRRRPSEPAGADPAEELRRKLAEAREAGGARDEDEAGETPVDAAEPAPPRSLEERRAAVHEKAQEALDEMRRLGGGDAE